MFFILLTLIVQIGFLVLARSAAASSIEASLRKAALGSADDETIRAGIIRDVRAVVPGAEDVDVSVSSSDSEINAALTFQWVPPGPDLIPVIVSIERSSIRVVPP